jgi:hypothetical protein
MFALRKNHPFICQPTRYIPNESGTHLNMDSYYS